MDEPGNHHSQQTDARTENQTPHIFAHRWVTKNENTGHREGKGTTLTGVGGGEKEGRDSGRLGG